MQRQNLNVSINLQAPDAAPTRTAWLRRAHPVPAAGVARQACGLRYRNAPPGIVSQGMGGKTSDRLVTRLCAGGRETCHETIDLHVGGLERALADGVRPRRGVAA